MIYKIIGLLIGLLIFGAGIGPNFIYLSDDGVQFLIGHIQFVAIFRSPTPRTWRLQADVVSSRMAYGMLQPYFSRLSACFFMPATPALIKKLRTVTWFDVQRKHA